MYFQYNLDEQQLRLLHSIIPSLNTKEVLGYIEDGDLHMLDRMKAYLVSSVTYNDHPIYADSMIIIAKNDFTAIEYYNDLTGLAGSVMGIISEHPDKMNVIEIQPPQDVA